MPVTRPLQLAPSTDAQLPAPGHGMNTHTWTARSAAAPSQLANQGCPEHLCFPPCHIRAGFLSTFCSSSVNDLKGNRSKICSIELASAAESRISQQAKSMHKISAFSRLMINVAICNGKHRPMGLDLVQGQILT